ncbi:MAG: hypothetical protein QY314_04655 [Candidatus Dojkabacteria bacterium]|nr:MAG: hypothetical protein QY314_04655 [Candidatus Dojkabacteria bacterium]
MSLSSQVPYFHPFVITQITVENAFLTLEGYYDEPYTHIAATILVPVKIIYQKGNWTIWGFTQAPNLSERDSAHVHPVALLADIQRIDCVGVEVNQETEDVTIHLQQHSHFEDYGLVFEEDAVELTGRQNVYKIYDRANAISILLLDAPYHP